jgi:hypothetical protein
MKKLKTFNIQNTDKDWITILNNTFINPLQQVKASLTGYGHQYDDPSSTGIHTLIFELDGGPTKKDLQFIQSLMYQDDSQPITSYTYYFGTLWIHIPYIA